MNIFGVGPAEAGLVFVIALIVVGPQRFPEIMRTAGRWYRMARAYSNEVMKDVRSAVDDIEREVRAETDDLKSVREFADIGKDLREARTDAEQIQRDTRSAMREEPSAAAATVNGASDRARKPVRPSQRAANDEASTPDAAAEAIPPIERTSGEVAQAGTADASTVPSAPSKPAETSFDPFKKEPPKKGPVLIPRESASGEGATADGDGRP